MKERHKSATPICTLKTLEDAHIKISSFRLDANSLTRQLDQPSHSIYLGCWIGRGFTFTFTLFGFFSAYFGDSGWKRGFRHFNAPKGTISFSPFSSSSSAKTQKPSISHQQQKRKITVKQTRDSTDSTQKRSQLARWAHQPDPSFKWNESDKTHLVGPPQKIMTIWMDNMSRINNWVDLRVEWSDSVFVLTEKGFFFFFFSFIYLYRNRRWRLSRGGKDRQYREHQGQFRVLGNIPEASSRGTKGRTEPAPTTAPRSPPPPDTPTGRTSER